MKRRVLFRGRYRLVRERLNEVTKPIHDKIFYCEKEIDDSVVEVALQYNESFTENTKYFANNVYNPEGEAWLAQTALIKVINDYARKNNLLKEKEENLTGEDVRDGLTAVILVKIPNPQFEGQTKSKLGNPRGQPTRLERVTREYLSYFFEENPAIAKAIINKTLVLPLVLERLPVQLATIFYAKVCSKARQCQVSSTTAQHVTQKKQNSFLQRVTLLVVLQLLVEIVISKQFCHYAVRSFNIERARLDKMLANNEIVNIVKALGVGIGTTEEQFNIEKLRYKRVILMTDADVDGSHIATLLLTFFTVT